MIKKFNKVFEVGSAKTGTTSLGLAYKRLGLKAEGYREDLDKDILNKERIYNEIHLFDAFQDGPWHNLPIDELDNRFPNSKFILLTRDDESWYKSMNWQFKEKVPSNWFINSSKEEMIAKKNKKYQEIINYFANEKEKLLVWNLIDDDNPWSTLVNFLEINVQINSLGPFPHLNKKSNFK